MTKGGDCPVPGTRRMHGETSSCRTSSSKSFVRAIYANPFDVHVTVLEILDTLECVKLNHVVRETEGPEF